MRSSKRIRSRRNKKSLKKRISKRGINKKKRIVKKKVSKKKRQKKSSKWMQMGGFTLQQLYNDREIDFFSDGLEVTVYEKKFNNTSKQSEIHTTPYVRNVYGTETVVKEGPYDGKYYLQIKDTADNYISEHEILQTKRYVLGEKGNSLKNVYANTKAYANKKANKDKLFPKKLQWVNTQSTESDYLHKGWTIEEVKQIMKGEAKFITYNFTGKEIVTGVYVSNNDNRLLLYLKHPNSEGLEEIVISDDEILSSTKDESSNPSNNNNDDDDDGDGDDDGDDDDD
jgi:hypothetical protein